jgi:hypothetical protein
MKKFRAWHPDLQLMWDFTFKDIRNGDLLLPDRNIWVEIEDLDIMEYIGDDYKNIKGRDIQDIQLCEGDIVVPYNRKIWFSAKIIRNPNNGGWALTISKSSYFQDIESWGKLKIIGNIYQNPESLVLD